MSLIRLDTAGALGTPEELDLSDKTPEELEEIAAPWPVHWLFPPEPGEPDRVVNLFAGPGGWDAGVRDVLHHDLDTVGVELHKDASATARAAGFARIIADVRSLDPKHPALRWVRGLIVSAPCQCWTPAGKRAGLDPANQWLLLDVFSMAFEATFGHWHDSGPCWEQDECLICGDPQWDGFGGFTGPLLTLDEVRAPVAGMTDERIGLLAEVLIWSLTLTAQWDNLRWLAMEQSSALPELVLDGIREELWSADWCSAEYRVLDAVDYGLASRRKRVFLMAARHAYVDMEALTPKASLPITTAAQALGWPAGIRVNTRGNRKTAGGNAWSADKPATGITSKIRGWYWEHDKDRRFSLDEAALLVGFAPGYPWTGSRSSCTQQIGDVVAPPVSCVVVGALLGQPWEDQLRAYLTKIYNHPADHTSPKENDMKPDTTTEIETEYGKVVVRRVVSDGVPEQERAWTTSYEITGPRMTGLVHVQPEFTGEMAELLPSVVALFASSGRFSSRTAHLSINGIDLDETHLYKIGRPEDVERFDFRRKTDDWRRKELSDAGTQRTRAALRAVLEAHFADKLHMHDQATAYAEARNPGRTARTLRAIEEKIKEAEALEARIEELREWFGTLGDLQQLAAAQRPAAPVAEVLDKGVAVVELRPELDSGEVPIAELRAGDRVRATGNNTLGRTVTRTGVLLADPKLVTVQDWGKRVKKWRLYIDEPGVEPTRSNSVTLWPDDKAERLADRDLALTTAA
ncbi:DNA cytosine methyltransferase [Streptomyces sp. NPDC045456]|uniref:DNA cytosine methyltransferase n=1 Tax=Streptomyces sp. NPDC045456 TaxID=3155254 RepID=UPI0033CD4623